MGSRRVIFGCANSLDHQIARPDHGVDWLLWSDDAAEIMREFWKTIDTVVMGRKTWEVAAGSGGGSGAYPGVKSYVLSRTLEPRKEKDLEFVAEDAGDFVRRLRAEPGKDICIMGGGELAKSLLEADLIDEIGVNMHPVLLGSGIPLFHPMNRQIDLELLECRQIQHGCVLLRYAVKHAADGKKKKGAKRGKKE